MNLSKDTTREHEYHSLNEIQRKMTMSGIIRGKGQSSSPPELQKLYIYHLWLFDPSLIVTKQDSNLPIRWKTFLLPISFCRKHHRHNKIILKDFSISHSHKKYYIRPFLDARVPKRFSDYSRF